MIKRYLQQHGACVIIIVLLLVVSIFTCSLLVVQRYQHPPDTQLYGTFGTSRVINNAIFLTIDTDGFYLYRGLDREIIDQGTWKQSDDTAILTGSGDVYSLLVKGASVYLEGEMFEGITRFAKFEEMPIFISTSSEPMDEH